MNQKTNEKKKQGNISKVISDENIRSAITRFTETSNPISISKNLRRILFGYLVYAKDVLPLDFEVCLNDIENLFELLDVLAEANSY